MKKTSIIQSRIFTLDELKKEVLRWRFANRTIAFTNGCFDILHAGHIASLSQAANEADILIVGVNSNKSTRRLKGNGRPVNDQASRVLLLASLIIVDAVIIFDEDTPLQLIKEIMPDVLVKGGDYTIEQIVGASEIITAGGRVVINSLLEDFSTTALLGKINSL